ncbi:MAG TPA: hypothetical protein EYP14_03755, partial [Planctomycetaceae bacterium]|nr:hypothetical protein [Planctomycetaceae bacterium]
GRAAQAHALLSRYGGRRVRVAGRTMLMNDWAARLPDRLPSGPPKGDWRGVLGNERRNAEAEGSAPFPRARWSVALDGATGPDPRVKVWQQRAAEEIVEPVGVALFPVAVAGQVIVRDFDGIRGLDAETGRLLWRYDSAVSWSQIITQFEQTFRQTPQTFNAAFVGNTTVGLLASDGQRVYAVELSRSEFGGASQPPVGPVNPFRRRGTDADDQRSAWLQWNRLVALPIPGRTSGPEGRTGREPIEVPRVQPVWSVGGPPGSDRPLAGHFFLNPPLAVDGELFVITESRGQLNLVALDPRTGGLIWSQGIALAEASLSSFSQHLRRTSTCTPAFADGLVLCPTDLGLLVAV